MIACPHCRHMLTTPTCHVCGAQFRFTVEEISPAKLIGRELIEAINVNPQVKKGMLEEWDNEHK